MKRSVGDSIRDTRKAIDLKQCILAKRLNIAKNTLSQYERGTRMPDLETAYRITNELNISMDYLCGVHDFKYNPKDEDFLSLIQIFDNCSQDKKKKIIKMAKQVYGEEK